MDQTNFYSAHTLEIHLLHQFDNSCQDVNSGIGYTDIQWYKRLRQVSTAAEVVDISTESWPDSHIQCSWRSNYVIRCLYFASRRLAPDNFHELVTTVHSFPVNFSSSGLKRVETISAVCRLASGTFGNV